jgi:PAS domain S-box-containing protein
MAELGRQVERVPVEASVPEEAVDPFYRDLVERANDLFVIVGGDGRVRFVNVSFCRLTGLEREEVEGTRLPTIFDEGLRQNAQSRLTKALQNGASMAVNLPLRTRDGEPIEIAFRPNVERTESGLISRLILVGQSPHLYGGLAEQFNTLHRDLKNYSQQLERLNAELEERIQERTLRLTALLQVSASLNAELQLDALFELVLRQAIETIAGAEAGVLLLYDADADRLRVQAACGYQNASIISDLQLELERVHPQSIVSDRKVRVWDGSGKPKTGQMRHLLYNTDRWRIRSAVSAPISTPTERLGVLLLHNFDDSKAFSGDDVALAASLAGSAAVAITNARLYEQTRWQADRLELVNRLSVSVRDSVDLQQTLDIAVEGLCLVLGASRAAVTLFDETAETAPYAAHYAEPGVKSLDERRSALVGTPLMREVLAFRAPRVVPDAHQDPRVAERRRELAELGVDSVAIVPLLVRGRFIGTVELHQCDRTRRWREAEVGLAEAVAKQVATGVHQVRLHAKLRETVRETTALFEQVARGKREWEATFDAMSDAVFLFDQHRRLLRANSAASALENRSFVEMNGTACCDILANVRGEDCAVERAMATGERVVYECVRSGQAFSITINPIVGDDGVATGAVAVVRDVTPSRQLAELLGQEEPLPES